MSEREDMAIDDGHAELTARLEAADQEVLASLESGMDSLAVWPRSWGRAPWQRTWPARRVCGRSRPAGLTTVTGGSDSRGATGKA
ncbi:hypothetical protein GCM10020254_82950 [Streptomyces goshikiensis]